MYCKKCGKEIIEDSIYCKYCGTRQTPQKITIEITKPSFTLNGNILRNYIFNFGSFLKKVIICIYPLVIRLILWGIISLIVWNGVYYIFQYIEKPPIESSKNIQDFKKYGVTTYTTDIN